MSNIRRLNDLKDQESRPLLASRPARNSSGPHTGKSARDEGFFETLITLFCPFIALRQFIFVISVIDIAVYITMIAYGGVCSDGFLAPTSTTLFIFGEKYPYYMKYEYQIWRFITPLFLHANFTHITMNIISQMVVGSMLEAVIGWKRTASIYFISGIGGTLFSSLISDSASVGASTCIFGLIGAYISFLIINWNQLDRTPQQKCSLVCFIIMILFINLMIGIGNSTIDNLGHLGGLFTGTLIGLFLIPPLPTSEAGAQKCYKYSRITGIISTIVYFILGFTLFYTLRTPSI